MERRKIERPDGSYLTLLVSGPSGAVTLDVWLYRSTPQGHIGIHYPHSHLEGERPARCEYLPGGQCYLDQTWREGMDAAPLVFNGREDEAWEVVERWYRTRIEGET